MNLLHRALYRDKFWKWPAIIGLSLLAIWWGIDYARAADRIVQHHDSRGAPISIAVTEDCHYLFAAAMNGAYADVPRGKIWLCGRGSDALPHELAHFAGMRHTRWYVNANHTSCARVIVAGYRTGYEVGDWICIGQGPAFLGEWVEK